MISTSRWPAWCTLPFSQRKVALSETIHSLLGTLFFYPLPPMKTFHFVQLLRAPFYLLDKMRFTQLLIKANSIFKFTLLIFFFLNRSGGSNKIQNKLLATLEDNDEHRCVTLKLFGFKVFLTISEGPWRSSSWFWAPLFTLRPWFNWLSSHFYIGSLWYFRLQFSLISRNLQFLFLSQDPRGIYEWQFTAPHVCGAQSTVSIYWSSLVHSFPQSKFLRWELLLTEFSRPGHSNSSQLLLT